MRIRCLQFVCCLGGSEKSLEIDDQRRSSAENRQVNVDCSLGHFNLRHINRHKTKLSRRQAGNRFRLYIQVNMNEEKKNKNLSDSMFQAVF